jgi:hypothetical protein
MQKQWKNQKASQQNPKTQKQHKRGKRGKKRKVKKGKKWMCPFAFFFHLFCFLDLLFVFSIFFCICSAFFKF